MTQISLKHIRFLYTDNFGMFTGDGLGASAALLGEQFPVAVRAVGLVVLGRELLLSQLLVTLGTGEALPVPGLVLVGHAPLVNHLSKLITVVTRL